MPGYQHRIPIFGIHDGPVQRLFIINLVTLGSTTAREFFVDPKIYNIMDMDIMDIRFHPKLP